MQFGIELFYQYLLPPFPLRFFYSMDILQQISLNVNFHLVSKGQGLSYDIMSDRYISNFIIHNINLPKGANMSKGMYKRYIEDFKANLLDCKFLGKGNNGIVYMLPEGKAIKVCFEEEKCRKEYFILKRIHNNKYFPRVYGMCGNYMIRDYVEGVPLNRYIRKHGLDRELAVNILKLLREFRKLKFAKEDVRCKDIMVQAEGTLMVIDPKKCYSKERDFPRHLCKGLYKLGVLDQFMKVVKETDSKSYKRWSGKINSYIQQLEREKESPEDN